MNISSLIISLINPFFVTLNYLKEVLFAFLLVKPITVPAGNLVIVFPLPHRWSSSGKFTSSIAFVVTLPHRLRLADFLKNKDAYFSLSGIHATKKRLFY